MRIFAVSDLHLSTTGEKPMDVFGGNWDGYFQKIEADWKQKVSADDLVLIAGDVSWAMDLPGAMRDVEAFASFPGKKVIIRGNHDYWWHSISKIRAALPEGIFALQNDAIKIGNVVVAGSRGWTVEGMPGFTEEDARLLKRETERFRLSLTAAEKLREEGDVLIAMIHYPPFNVRREDSPFTALFEEFRVDKAVYGHLHGKDVRADLEVRKNGVTYYLTSCDQIQNRLVRIL